MRCNDFPRGAAAGIIRMARQGDFGRFARSYNAGVHGAIPCTRSYTGKALDPKLKHYGRMNVDAAPERAQPEEV